MFLDFTSAYNTALSIILGYWWAWLPVVLFISFISAWQSYIIRKKLESLNWILLEIKTPADIEKSPKVTEQLFAGLHGAWRPITPKQKFFYGETLPWFSLEVVGRGGDTRFYIRTPESYRNIVESQIFAQYPDAEIEEVEDYVKDLPALLPNDDYNLWGAEFKLAKEEVYPIRTYYEFEEAGGLGEAKRIDPLASFAEVLGKLHSGEQIWIQFIIQPDVSNWMEPGKQLINRLIGKDSPKKRKGGLLAVIDALDSLIPGGGKGGKKEEKKEESRFMLSSTEKEAADAINRKINKLGFKSNIRFLYIGRKEIFHMSHIAGIFGAFKQFASQNLNSFVPSYITGKRGWFYWLTPSEKGLFQKQQEYNSKAMLYSAARNRNPIIPWTGSKQYILTTEELATLYHLPGLAVRAPLLPRIYSKKGQPPSELPTE